MAFVSSKQVGGASSTTVTGTQPAGIVAGYQLLAYAAQDTPGNTHTSTGATWAKLDNTSISGPDGQTLSLWARVATGTDTFSLSSTGGGQWAVTIAAFSGRNASTSPTFSVTTPNTAANASPVTVTLTGVTAAAGDDIAAWYDLDCTNDTVTYATTTTPAALTLREDCLPSLQWCPSALATADNVSAGATGNIVFVATGATMTAGFGGYVVTMTAAVTGPILSAPTPSGTLNADTTATVGCTTDTSSGTLYVVLDTIANISGISIAQVKAGQNNTGSAAPFSNTNTVSTSTPSVNISGLTPGTLYSYAIVQNAVSGDSNLLTGTFITGYFVNVAWLKA